MGDKRKDDGTDGTDSGAGAEVVTVGLQARHLDWLRRAAAAAGRTVTHHLEWIVRQAYAADPTKGGVAGGGSVRAVDFKVG